MRLKAIYCIGQLHSEDWIYFNLNVLSVDEKTVAVFP